MSEERKKRVWTWIVAILIGLPVLYVTSFGPACWLTGRRADRWKCPRPMIVYWPLGHAFNAMGAMRQDATNPAINTWAHEALMWWMTVGLPKGGSAITPTSYDMTKIKVVEPPQR